MRVQVDGWASPYAALVVRTLGGLLEIWASDFVNITAALRNSLLLLLMLAHHGGLRRVPSALSFACELAGTVHL